MRIYLCIIWVQSQLRISPAARYGHPAYAQKQHRSIDGEPTRAIIQAPLTRLNDTLGGWLGGCNAATETYIVYSIREGSLARRKRRLQREDSLARRLA